MYQTFKHAHTHTRTHAHTHTYAHALCKYKHSPHFSGVLVKRNVTLGILQNPSRKKVKYNLQTFCRTLVIHFILKLFF